MEFFHASAILALLLYFILITTPQFTNCIPLRMQLVHVNAASTTSLTDSQLLQRALSRSNNRVSMLAKRSKAINKVEAPVHFSEGEYLIELAIGTPAKSFSAILDTGSDLTWVQCKPCIHCLPQPNPLFDPTTSHSYSKILCDRTCKALVAHPSCKPTKSCRYSIKYDDNSTSKGTLSRETFTLGSTPHASIPNILFGCADLNTGILANSSGVIGFGRGPLSLITQLGVKKFAYCLTSYSSAKKSPLLFDSLADTKNTLESTPLVKTPIDYHLSLKGITVGSVKLQIPTSTFEFRANGDGGLIIDSGTLFTYLETRAYQSLKKTLSSQMKLPVSNITTEDHHLDLCFSLSSLSREVEVPKLIFHFDGADMDVPEQNFLYKDRTLGLLCLAILDAGELGLSIIGSYLQQNMLVVYDIEESKLSFAPAQCDEL